MQLIGSMPLLKFNTTPSSMNSNAVSLVLILIKLVFKLGSFDSSGWIAKHQAAHGKMARFLKLSLTVTTPSQQQSPCIYIIRRQMLFGYRGDLVSLDLGHNLFCSDRRRSKCFYRSVHFVLTVIFLQFPYFSSQY